ncbi:hypothetical protein LJB88_03170 [Erysipelotrichaceae bacterium OttesenSCG-928-M19]|nr:hypothetical protein [Erysipelotrichaceae bacterium OttesenSCG-928-M19]
MLDRNSYELEQYERDQEREQEKLDNFWSDALTRFSEDIQNILLDIGDLAKDDYGLDEFDPRDVIEELIY